MDSVRADWQHLNHVTFPRGLVVSQRDPREAGPPPTGRPQSVQDMRPDESASVALWRAWRFYQYRIGALQQEKASNRQASCGRGQPECIVQGGRPFPLSPETREKID